MENKNNVKMKVKEFFFLFLIATILFVLASYIAGIEPFGNHSFFVADAEHQYYDFFNYFKRVLSGEANVDYSFSKSLGGSVYALYAYYLSSPINLILFFFNVDKIYIGFYVITLIKLALCATNFNIFLSHKFEKLNIYIRFALSLSYAFMQYTITQMQNIMWLDGVVLLPLLLLAVYMFVKNNKKIFLYFMVMFSIIANWYTAYMNCIFIVMFFVVEMICVSNLKKPKEWLLKTGKFIVIEFLGVMGSMFFFYPAIIGLLQGKGMEKENIFQLGVSTEFGNLFTGYNLGNGLFVEPSFYCGIICFVLAVCFFIDKNISKKLRICYFVLLSIMIFSCWFMPLQNIWNGMRWAYSYFYRFSYIICGLYIIIIAQYIENLKVRKFNIKHCIVMLMYIFLTVGLYKTGKLESDTGFYTTIAFSAVWLIFILFYKIKNFNKIGTVAFCVIMILEVEANTAMLCDNIYNKTFELKDFSASQRDVVAYIEKKETEEFYRMEQTDPYTRSGFCESLAYNYNGIAHYSSAYDTKTGAFLRALGYGDYRKASAYREPVLTADSLLGVKYVWSKRQQEEFIPVADVEDYHLYENEYALPIGFRISSNKLKLNKYSNPFIFQNKLYSKIIGREIELFKKVEVKTEVKDGSLFIYNEEKVDGFLYGYFRTSDYGLDLYVNDEYYYPYSVFMSSLTFSCGFASQENEIKLENVETAEGEMEIWALDTELYKDVVNEIRKNSFQVKKVEDGYVTGSYQAEKDGYIMFTIPNVQNWKATVNGVTVEIQDAYETFISIPVKEGENKIVLEYQLPGVKEGIVLSIVSLVIISGWYLYSKRETLRDMLVKR